MKWLRIDPTLRPSSPIIPCSNSRGVLEERTNWFIKGKLENAQLVSVHPPAHIPQGDGLFSIPTTPCALRTQRDWEVNTTEPPIQRAPGSLWIQRIPYNPISTNGRSKRRGIPFCPQSAVRRAHRPRSIHRARAVLIKSIRNNYCSRRGRRKTRSKMYPRYRLPGSTVPEKDFPRTILPLHSAALNKHSQVPPHGAWDRDRGVCSIASQGSYYRDHVCERAQCL